MPAQRRPLRQELSSRIDSTSDDNANTLGEERRGHPTAKDRERRADPRTD